MKRQNRLTLQSNFRTGARPTQEDFENVFESFINIEDDKVSVDNNKNLKVGGAITLGNSGKNNTTAPSVAGTIRWNGSEFEVYDGEKWGPLGGGNSNWTSDSGNLLFTGKVGIGSLKAPADVLEVAVGDTKRVKLGNAAIGNGYNEKDGMPNNAFFSHTKMRGVNSYALMQDLNGATYINSGGGHNISFCVNNNAYAFFNHDGLFVIGHNKLLVENDSDFKLQVKGKAYKTEGSAWDTISDIRTKEDIQSFNDGMEMLKKIEPIRFKFNGNANTQQGLECIGVSAQDLEKIFPYMVNRIKINKEKSGLDSDELLTTNLSALQFVLINAIKEMDNRIERLEKLSKKNK